MFRQSLRSIARANKVSLTRGYAEAASSDVLKLSFTLPHEALYSKKAVTQVNVPGASGEMGILANHVPIVEQLKPGVVEVIESTGSTKYFVSGGFVSVLPDSSLNITAIEAFPLDSFSSSKISSLLSEAQKNAASADEAVSAEASIEIEVLEALQAATK
ncbi:unnamed protein product [[Candida] boidinii]|uniref:ATP synthase subunit delta, mitochondrial n=1 Tax=Candida boidinii TaxID=5477 RepID=A0A9W6SSZ7_CANBO|nr:hypothetical protein B5S33_g151 [[Candida] boidinii]GME66696.1 unnamed protein product [[Candida] boidinii]GMF49905.1 unnamed protein product [[Candida] boidinii]GMF99659.1 unnamed protein product [[Candida] boidinii]